MSFGLILILKETNMEKFVYIVNTQNLEEYGSNFHKFKGGSTYVVHAELTKEIFERDAYGPGEHDYYEVPSVTEASVAAEVMKHVNRYNGLRGSFDYITSIEKLYLEDYLRSPEEDIYFQGSFNELISETYLHEQSLIANGQLDPAELGESYA